MTCYVPALTTALQISGCTAGRFVDYDSTCQYTCTLGYNLIGQDKATCNTDGMLSADTPRCEGKIFEFNSTLAALQSNMQNGLSAMEGPFGKNT